MHVERTFSPCPPVCPLLYAKVIEKNDTYALLRGFCARIGMRRDVGFRTHYRARTKCTQTRSLSCSNTVLACTLGQASWLQYVVHYAFAKQKFAQILCTGEYHWCHPTAVLQLPLLQSCPMQPQHVPPCCVVRSTPSWLKVVCHEKRKGGGQNLGK